MDSQRNLLFFALLLVSFLIWMTWTQDNAVKPLTNQPTTSAQTQQAVNGDVANGQKITVQSDVLKLVINTQGGDVEEADLLAYNATLKSDNPFKLLRVNPNFLYVAQSGLIGRQGIDTTNGRPAYEVAASDLTLSSGQDELRVPLVYRANGLEYTKTFVLKRGKYDVGVEYHIKNMSEQAAEVVMYGQLKQTTTIPKSEQQESGGNLVSSAYRGTAYSSDASNYKKYSFDDIASSNLSVDSQTGWVAMLQQYFSTAWIPQNEGMNHFYTNRIAKSGVNESIIGFKSEPVMIPAQGEKTLSAKLWVGPELQSDMEAAAPHLDLAVDYGWFWFISKPLFVLLKLIQSVVVNWGVAIILITFVVRGLMYPLTKAQYTSMAKMRLLQPRIEALRERFGDDKQRMSQEMMGLYKKEKVNPLGGCLPLIIQMPIFLGLFYMLSSSVELRHAPFALWIQDLSAKDPYFILPLLMGGTMFLIQKMSPTPVSDPMQQKLMTYMPLVFTVFFLWFPSGLVLYYTVSNLVTIIQQQLIYRGLEKRGLHTREKKKKA